MDYKKVKNQENVCFATIKCRKIQTLTRKWAKKWLDLLYLSLTTKKWVVQPKAKKTVTSAEVRGDREARGIHWWPHEIHA
jgi:hypothetical protein